MPYIRTTPSDPQRRAAYMRSTARLAALVGHAWGSLPAHEVWQGVYDTLLCDAIRRAMGIMRGGPATYLDIVRAAGCRWAVWHAQDANQPAPYLWRHILAAARAYGYRRTTA